MNIGFVKLGDVCEIKRGTTITQKNAVEGNVPVVAGGIKPTYYHNAPNRLGKTITISGSGANAGYVNLWDVPIFASDCSTVQVNREDLSINYVHYFLLSKQDYIYKELRSGAAQPHVYGKDIANIEINLPSLATQQKIVEKLDAIFAEIDRATVAAEANVKNANYLTLQVLQNLDDEYDGEFKSLGSCVDLVSGFAFKSNEYTSNESDIPLLRGDNLNPKSIDLSNAKRYDKNRFDEFKKFSLRVGDIVLGMDRPLISTGLRIAKIENDDLPLLLVQRVMRMRCNEGVDSDFIFYQLNSERFIKHLLGEQTGLGVPHISGKTISSFQLKIPSLVTQKIIVNKLNLLSEQLFLFDDSALKLQRNFHDLKNSILKQAFNGELVKE